MGAEGRSNGGSEVKKIVVINNKGGVGKTTVACQLAFHLAEAGRSVVALDLDPQKNMTKVMRRHRAVGASLDMINEGVAPDFEAESGELVVIESDTELPVTSNDQPLQNLAVAIAGLKGADFCVIDTPPSFSALVYGALLASDYAISPIELKMFSIDGIEGVLKAFVQAKEINGDIEFLGILPSRFDAVKVSEREALKELLETFDGLTIPHALRNRTAYTQSMNEAVHLKHLKGSSGKEAAAEFQAFFDWMMESIGEVQVNG